MAQTRLASASGSGASGPIAPLQALDAFEPRGQRPEVGVFVERALETDSAAIGNGEEMQLNIILVSDSLAKSRHDDAVAVARSLLIALRHPALAGFVLAMATYVVTMKFAVDLPQPVPSHAARRAARGRPQALRKRR